MKGLKDTLRALVHSGKLDGIPGPYLQCDKCAFVVPINLGWEVGSVCYKLREGLNCLGQMRPVDASAG